MDRCRAKRADSFINRNVEFFSGEAAKFMIIESNQVGAALIFLCSKSLGGWRILQDHRTVLSFVHGQKLQNFIASPQLSFISLEIGETWSSR